MSEKRKVPKLRFPGFSDNWVEKKLGPISSKVGSGKTPRGGDQTYQTSGIPFIRSQNVQNSKLQLDGVCISPETHSEMANSAVVSGDVLLNITGGSIGRSCVVPENFQEGNVNQHVCIIRLKKDSPNFLHSILSSHRGQKLIFQGQTGSGREGLNFESIKAFKINVPSVSEQQKISGFLTAVDRRIELLQQKKEKLERYKKSVMQQIFTRKIRFKAEEGSEFPDWEEKKLGEVAKIYQPKTISQSDLTETGFDVFGANGIIGKFHSFNHEQSQVAITCRGNTCGTVNWTNPRSWITGNAMVVNVDDSSELYKRFLYYALRFSDLNYLITGSGQPQITGIIKFHKIHIPKFDEQLKICQFLDSVDQFSEKVAAQIQQSQTWRKGLLQQMFV